MVTSITWVDGRGVVHTSARDSPEGRGLCSGMGLLGVVTELQLQLQVRGRRGKGRGGEGKEGKAVITWQGGRTYGGEGCLSKGLGD
jgi:hypothetical protein